MLGGKLYSETVYCVKNGNSCYCSLSGNLDYHKKSFISSTTGLVVKGGDTESQSLNSNPGARLLIDFCRINLL